jgi:hypothetical protein
MSRPKCVRLWVGKRTSVGLNVPGIYRIPCECGKVYVGQTGRTIEIRCKEHKRHIRLGQPDKSAVAEHSIEAGHNVDFNNITILKKVTIYGPPCKRSSRDPPASQELQQGRRFHLESKPTKTNARSHVRKLQVLQSKCLRTEINAPWYVSTRQIHEDLEIPFFADHIRALTESFDSKLADAGNPLVRQLGRHLCRPRSN